MTGLTELEWMKLAIYYASYLYFIAAPFAVWLAVKKAGVVRWLLAGFLVVISRIAYGRFIEPRSGELSSAWLDCRCGFERPLVLMF